VKKDISVYLIKSLLVMGVVFISTSCNFRDKPATGQVLEGTIIYAVTYPAQLKSNSLFFLLPDKAELHFSNGRKRVSINGGLGLYDLQLLVNPETSNFHALLQVFDQKRYFTESLDNAFLELREDLVPVNNAGNEQAREIAGFRCYNVRLKSTNHPSAEFSVWYTTEIGSRNPNANTPLDIIPGIIMEIEAHYGELTYNLRAEQVLAVQHEENFFDKPSGYEPITRQELEKLYEHIN